jgi:hypothetical protein
MSLEQGLTVTLSVITLAGTAINVFVGLRLSAMQERIKAENAALEIALLKQFVHWKDDVLQAINGKYVSAALIAEIRANIGREVAQTTARLDHIEDRCDDRRTECNRVMRMHGERE